MTARENPARSDMSYKVVDEDRSRPHRFPVGREVQREVEMLPRSSPAPKEDLDLVRHALQELSAAWRSDQRDAMSVSEQHCGLGEPPRQRDPVRSLQRADTRPHEQPPAEALLESAHPARVAFRAYRREHARDPHG